MPKRKSKHGDSETVVSMKPTGGLDLSKSPVLLEPDKLAVCQNFMYEPQSARLVVRHGIQRLTTTPFPGSINGQKGLQFTGTAHWAVACDDGKLYDLADDGTYTEIGSLTDVDIRPSMMQFNQRLLVADKSPSGIRYWDGTTYGHLAGSPTKPSALLEVGNRVLSNTEDYPDLLHISGPEDDEDWDTSAEGAAAAVVPVGYGDGLQVNAITAYGREVIVSKIGTQAKSLRRFSMTGTPDTWRNSDKPFSTITAAQSQSCLIGTANGVYVMDRDGFKSIVPSDVEGGLLVDESDGARVNKYLLENFLASALELVYLPAYGAIAMVLANNTSMFLFSLYNRAWTEILFPGSIGDITSIAVTTNGARIGTSTGHIYTWEPGLATDDLGDDVTSDIASSVALAELQPEYQVLSKHTILSLIPITNCTGVLNYASSGDETSVLTWEIRGQRLSLWDLQDIYVADWDEEYQDATTGSIRVCSKARFRGDTLQVVVRTTSGRCGIDNVQLRAALVG